MQNLERRIEKLETIPQLNDGEVLFDELMEKFNGMNAEQRQEYLKQWINDYDNIDMSEQEKAECKDYMVKIWDILHQLEGMDE